MGETRIEQHIAVFGESGSGKTVLLSSFYGATQQKQYVDERPYQVIADSQTDARVLLQNYLGMRRSGEAPLPTRFASHSFGFSIKPKIEPDAKKRSVNSIRVVWHDYPGEWFEKDLTGSEAEERVATFQKLLRSDVSLILIDGQRLLDNAGEEDRYLKSVLANINDGLRRLHDQVPDGEKLEQFPRIWLFALSKCDLLPEVDAYAFRDLLVEKAAFEIGELERTLRYFVDTPEALAIGEDFVLLSSAKFEPGGKIDLAQRIGVDLMLPLAAVLPFERFARWAQRSAAVSSLLLRLAGSSGKVVDVLGKIASAALVLRRAPNRFVAAAGKALAVAGPLARELSEMSVARIEEAHRQASAKHDVLHAALLSFKLALGKAEKEQKLLRSAR